MLQGEYKGRNLKKFWGIGDELKIIYFLVSDQHFPVGLKKF
jgi:hypothetical protein